jgi:LPS export ABC transporter protein LptC
MKTFSYLLFILIISCTNDLEEVKKIAQPVDVNREEGKNINIRYTELGKLRANLTAPLVYRITQPNISSEFPQGMHLDLFNESGVIENTLDAMKGSIDDTRHIMTASDKVVVINIRGDKLETESLSWDQNTKKIYSSAFVKITTAKEIIMGDSLEADEKFTDYRIKRVTGTVQVKK